jgi:GNAT superfamily N-acetyltransferase
LKTETRVRLARPGEEAAIHAVHMRSIREVCVKDHGEEEIRGWGFRELGNRWTDAIQRQEVWVVEKEASILGMSSIHVYAEGSVTKADLLALYLAPEVLGQKLGARLMTTMLDHAKKCGVHRVDLDSTITALQFYESFGFKATGPSKRLDIGGYPVTAHPMVLLL